MNEKQKAMTTCGTCMYFAKCNTLTPTSPCDYNPSRHRHTGDPCCPDCGYPIAIRNPSGHCDHLKYPEYKKKPTDVAPMSREEIIADLQANLEGMPPEVLASHAIMLAGYLSAMTTEIATASQAYYKKWCAIREYAHITTDGRATQEAKASDEYYKKKKLSLEFDATKEMINAIKKKLGFDEADYRQTGGQNV